MFQTWNGKWYFWKVNQILIANSEGYQGRTIKAVLSHVFVSTKAMPENNARPIMTRTN